MKQRNTKRLFAFVLALAMVVAGSGVSGLTGSTVASAAKSSVSLSKTKATLTVGKKTTLKIKKKNIKKISSQKWTSSKKSVATVSKKGVVTAKKAGKATIKCTVKYVAKGAKKAKKKTLKCTVTVNKKSTATRTPATPTPVPTINPEDPIQGVITKDQITYSAKVDDTTNKADEREVTIEGTGTKMKVKDNGIMRPELSSTYLAQNEMGQGINLGNTMESVYSLVEKDAALASADLDPTWFDKAWGQPTVTQEYIDKIHSYGINTIRIPVAWTKGDNDDGTYTIDARLLGRIEEIVNYALNNGMYVIINDHWDNQWWGQFGACKRDENNKKVANEEMRAEAWKRYEAYWTQIATRFQGYSDHLIFEGANEELGARLNDAIYPSTGYNDTRTEGEKSIGGNLKTAELYDMVNKINQKFVDVIRSTGGNNAYRHLLIPGYDTTIDKTADARFIMPKDTEENGTSKLFVSVHYYTPWDFCGDDGEGDYTYEDRDALAGYLEPLQRFVDEGYGIIIGEGGVCNPIQVNGSVTQWFHDVYKECEKYSAVFCFWETGQYFDRTNVKLKFEDIGFLLNEISGFNGVLEGGLTGIANNSTELTSVEGKTPVWSWDGIWYKNGGDYKVGPNRYSDDCEDIVNINTGTPEEIAKKFVPESKTTATIAGDQTSISFDATGFQAFLKVDVSKYKNPAIAFKFADGTPTPEEDAEADIVGRVQLGVNNTASFKEDVGVQYEKYNGRAIPLKDRLQLSADKPYLSIAFANKPTVTGIYIYDLDE